ncbi:N-acetylmuramoyl-L-alanine amidase [Rhodobacteraceae bacterium CCMM004]|nr:N-acetylmuramoyl-L-alanine amidase [Rhodobacteraceae bacterium CCMM004]
MTWKSVIGGALVALSVAVSTAAGAETDLTALARPDPQRSEIVDFGADVQITLALSQPVPWRVFTLDGPPRLILDFGEVAFSGIDLDELLDTDRITGIAAGPFRRGWSRMVLELAEPLRVETAGMSTVVDGAGALLRLQLAPTDAASFAAEAGEPEVGPFALPDPAAESQPGVAGSEGALHVAIDPGHGGLDPGAEAGGLREADLMLGFAMELRATLQAAGMTVTLTRDSDIFVPLIRRVSRARAAGADVFLSLHADALAEGVASGATVYTLSEDASDVASEQLAERHDRGDLLGGVDLSTAGDAVAVVLMDLVRAETGPRSERLADALVAGLAARTGDLHKRPRLRAGFSVLRAPDIPSVLIELGFLSSAGDRANLTDPDWRAAAAAGIRDALTVWAEEDAARAPLRLK